MVRHPVERLISWFHYIRIPTVIQHAERMNPNKTEKNKTLQNSEWLNKVGGKSRVYKPINYATSWCLMSKMPLAKTAKCVQIMIIIPLIIMIIMIIPFQPLNAIFTSGI
jgi:hypothetical protein